jgi:acyl carrier protein
VSGDGAFAPSITHHGGKIHTARRAFFKGGALEMVFEKVRDILCQQLDVEENDVTMESSLTDDLGADSLDLVDTVMSLEDEFDIEVPDSAIEEIKTVGDIVAYIEKNQ